MSTSVFSTLSPRSSSVVFMSCKIPGLFVALIETIVNCASLSPSTTMERSASPSTSPPMSAPSATARVIRRDPRTSTRDFSETGAARRGRTTKVLAPPLEFPLLEFLPRGAAPRRSAAGADATDMARGRFENLRYTQRLSAVYGDGPREGLWRPKRDLPLDRGVVGFARQKDFFEAAIG